MKIYILFELKDDCHKHLKIFENMALTNDQDSPSTTVRMYPSYGVFNSTSAVSSIYLAPSTGNFTSGTVLLYGVK